MDNNFLNNAFICVHVYKILIFPFSQFLIEIESASVQRYQLCWENMIYFEYILLTNSFKNCRRRIYLMY